MDFYLSLLSQGWRMNDIDDMDMLRYLDLMIRSKVKKNAGSAGLPDGMPALTTIDQIQW